MNVRVEYGRVFKTLIVVITQITQFICDIYAILWKYHFATRT